MSRNYFLEHNDWRKQAAMTATSDLDIEKAFSDQASGFVENKLGPLMKDKHRVGFEIVKKNDENTRMVGVFAFKVSKNLLFAPVFFINGDIKGPLLYRCDTKTFVPATKDWATYLIEALERTEGRGRDTSRRSDSPPLVHMQRIAFMPSSMGKVAGVTEENKPAIVRQYKVHKTDDPNVYTVTMPDDDDTCIGNTSSDWALDVCEDCADGTTHVKYKAQKEQLTQKQAAAIKDGILEIEGAMFKLASDVAEDLTSVLNEKGDADWYTSMKSQIAKEACDNEGLLKELLTEVDYGKIAAEAIIKAAEANPAFAEQVARLYGAPENLFPETYFVSEKQAAKKPELNIIYDAGELQKRAGVVKDEYFQDGFYILDERPVESMSVLFEEAPKTITTPNGPGVYDVLKDDGSFESNVLIAPHYEGDFCYAGDGRGRRILGYAAAAKSGDWDSDKEDPILLLIKDGKATSVSPAVLVRYAGEITNYDKFTDEVSANNIYYAYVDDKLVGPIAINSVKTEDGVKYCEASVATSYHDRTKVYNQKPYAGLRDKIIINKDLDRTDLGAGTFGKDAKFVRVEHTPLEHEQKFEDTCLCVKPIEGITGPGSIDKFVFNSFKMPDLRIVRMFKEASTGVRKEHFTIHSGDLSSAPMSKLQTLVKLARDLDIHGEQAYALLKEASENGEVKRYLSMNKEASRLHLVDQPDFSEEFDSDFGVPIQPSKAYRLRVHGDQEFETPSAIGDAMNPTTLTGLPDLTVATSDPAELQGLADAYKLPHVFEHAVVGTLADTFNALPLVKKYTASLEDGVDALGRIKFLIHWCPNDFERAYGEDELMNLEAEVDSCFVAQGNLLLKLLKKSEALQKENGSENEEKKENE